MHIPKRTTKPSETRMNVKISGFSFRNYQNIVGIRIHAHSKHPCSILWLVNALFLHSIEKKLLVHTCAVPKEVLRELPANLLLSNVNQIALHGVVQIVCADDLALEKRTVGVADLP